MQCLHRKLTVRHEKDFENPGPLVMRTGFLRRDDLLEEEVFATEGSGFDHIAVVWCFFSKHPLCITSAFLVLTH